MFFFTLKLLSSVIEISSFHKNKTKKRSREMNRANEQHEGCNDSNNLRSVQCKRRAKCGCFFHRQAAHQTGYFFARLRWISFDTVLRYNVKILPHLLLSELFSNFAMSVGDSRSKFYEKLYWSPMGMIRWKSEEKWGVLMSFILVCR